MIVAVGGLKGGSGKTTVATNLAILRSAAGRNVLLVDADRQATASDFSSLRNEATGGRRGYTCLQIVGRAVRPETRRLAGSYDDVVIDTNGQDADGQRGAMLVADALLVPFVPQGFDFWTLDRVVDAVTATLPFNPRLRGYTFLNRADPRKGANDEAIQLLNENRTLRYLPAPLVIRKAFGVAASQGLAVTELQPIDRKAARETRALCEMVFRACQ